MAKGKRIHTITGQITDASSGTEIRHMTFNGSFTRNWEIIDLECWPAGVACERFVLHVKGSGQGAADADNNVDSNNQVAWFNYSGDGAPTGSPNAFKATQPYHVLVDDLFVCAKGSPAGPVNTWNYMITLQELKTSEAQAALAMIKSHSQDMDDT